MKSTIAIIFGLLLLGSASFAQQKENKEKLEQAKRKAADERSRSFGARRSPASLDKSTHGAIEDPTDNINAAKDKKESNEGKSDSNKDEKQPGDNQGKNTDADKSNAPAVTQATTSESGSPAILSENNGNGRDGTNNVQRATMKMAGAEVSRDLGLYKRDNSDKNVQAPKRIRKQEEQPPLVSDRPSQQQNEEAVIVQEAQEQTENAVKKEGDKKETKKQKGKKKSRKSKERDSGK